MNINRTSLNAFTLIEVILAVAIMAIVLSVITTVFFSALRLRQRTVDLVDQVVPTQQALTILRRDLQCARPPGGILAGVFTVGDISVLNLNQTAAIELCTATGALRENEPWSDVQRIAYGLKDPAVRTTPGGKDLIRSVTRNLLNSVSPAVEEQWILGDVQNIKFECFDGAQWLDTWDTTLNNTNLPAAVRVSIQLASSTGSSANQEPITIVVPIVSQSSTNQIPSATATRS